MGSAHFQLNYQRTDFLFSRLVHIGGVVSARSVKLLDRILHPEEPETRDAWWAEIRTEIRSHCRAMGCHAVVGYRYIFVVRQLNVLKLKSGYE